jgi:hypothetical protein
MLFEIDQPILEHGGEVYGYVGDEVIEPRFPGCRLPKETLLRSSTPGKAEKAGNMVGASREVAQTQLFGAAPPSGEQFPGRSWSHLACWAVVHSALPILMPGAAVVLAAGE